MVALDDAGAIVGVCYFGPQFVPAFDDMRAGEAFARHAERRGAPRMIVGTRSAVETFARLLRRGLPTPAAIRVSQPVYALTRADLRGSRDDAAVERATLGELDEIAAHSARMIAGEVGGSDRVTASVRERTERMVREGWWWRCRRDGELVFQCNVGSATAQTAQLQGVWTPVAHRGRGDATRALGAICDLLLDEYPSLCLYVNDFNTKAIALYERIGFRRVGEFSTILF